MRDSRHFPLNDKSTNNRREDTSAAVTEHVYEPGKVHKRSPPMAIAVVHVAGPLNSVAKLESLSTAIVHPASSVKVNKKQTGRAAVRAIREDAPRTPNVRPVTDECRKSPACD